MRAVLIWLVLATGAAHAAPVYPAKTWVEKTPADVGMDQAKLEAMSRHIGGRGCVIRNGVMVHSWGDASRRADIASAAKPFYSHFLFAAVESGKIPSLEEKAAKWEPRLQNINADLGHKDRAITWRHFATQTSCYQLVEKPGAAYAYNDWQMALFWDTLFLKVYGADYATVDEKVFRPLLTDKLQCEDNPTMMAFGTRNRAGRVAISVRDFARFGLLYLHGGKWRDDQLINAELAKMAVTSPLPNTIPRAGKESAQMIGGQRSMGSRSQPDNQTDHYGSYSWLWWTNGVDRDGTRMFPDAPEDLYGAFGHGGPRALWVIPSLDIVVSYNDSKMKTWTSGRKNPTNEAMRLLVAACEAEDAAETTAIGCDDERPSFAKWSKIELQFAGPTSIGRGDPNPFAVEFDVTFTSPSGVEFKVPGFYDGDGRGQLDGNVWKARFSADEVGAWKFRTASTHRLLHDQRGEFRVGETPGDAAGFWKHGRLEYVGTPENKIRYLKFRDGSYWLKAGCDDPENFLGNYKHFNTLEKRKAAIDYLARQGINSLYIMTHNIGGDDKDVWPWLGESTREAMKNGGASARFDLAKLDEWRELFEHMQTRGVVPYIILEDDSAWKGYDHARYYREIIARFGYLPALVFNLGEEHNENYSLKEALAHLGTLEQLDPYNHPRGIHNVNRPSKEYVDADHVDFTAIQTGSPGSRRGLKNALEHNRLSIDWIKLCESRGRRVLVANFDEARPEEDRRCWWSVYLGGGVWETHVLQPYDRPFSAWEPAWKELGGARAFMESVPFWKMQPHNELVQEGNAFCLARPGEVYALYLPTGGSIEVNLAPDTTYEVAWWNPSNGLDGELQVAKKTAGGVQRFTAPSDQDWALRIVRDSAE